MVASWSVPAKQNFNILTVHEQIQLKLSSMTQNKTMENISNSNMVKLGGKSQPLLCELGNFVSNLDPPPPSKLGNFVKFF